MLIAAGAEAGFWIDKQHREDDVAEAAGQPDGYEKDNEYSQTQD